MTDTRRRVKLYELNAERQWDDKGTGRILDHALQPLRAQYRKSSEPTKGQVGLFYFLT